MFALIVCITPTLIDDKKKLSWFMGNSYIYSIFLPHNTKIKVLLLAKMKKTR